MVARLRGQTQPNPPARPPEEIPQPVIPPAAPAAANFEPAAGGVPAAAAEAAAAPAPVPAVVAAQVAPVQVAAVPVAPVPPLPVVPVPQVAPDAVTASINKALALPRFDNRSSMTIEEWLKRFKDLAVERGFPAKKQAELLPLLCSGDPYTFLSSLYVPDGMTDLERLNFLVTSLRRAFGIAPEVAMARLCSRMLQAGESLDVFANDLVKSAVILWPDMSSSVRDRVVCDFFWRNLAATSKDDESKTISLRSTWEAQTEKTLGSAVQICRPAYRGDFVTACTVVHDHARQGSQQRKRGFGQSSSSSSSNCQQDQKRQKRADEGNEVKCWKCGGSGHMKKDCPSKSSSSSSSSSKKPSKFSDDKKKPN